MTFQTHLNLNFQRASTLLTCSLLACLGLTCTKSSQPPDQLTASIETQTDLKIENEKASVLKAFRSFSLDGLDDDGKQSFINIVNDEICPCDCPKTWAQCLDQENACQVAVLLAGWLKQGLIDGFPADKLATVLSDEIAAFQAPPQKIETQGYNSKGQSNSEFTIVEFADFQCPHCRELGVTLDQLLAQHPEVQIVFKHFPISFHPMALSAALSVEAAAKQGKFWDMHDAIFKTQAYLDEDTIIGHARVLSLNMDQFEKDRSSKEIQDLVNRSKEEAISIKVEATPAVFINGRQYHLLREIESFKIRFAMERARQKMSCH
jgi:protein-disulfide isomerase